MKCVTRTKRNLEYSYLKISLDLDGVRIPLSDVEFKMAILEALQQLHGEVGKATQVDVLKFDSNTFQAIIRVPSSATVNVWSALTVYGSYNGHACAFRVHQVSEVLMALAVNSREAVYS